MQTPRTDLAVTRGEKGVAVPLDLDLETLQGLVLHETRDPEGTRARMGDVGRSDTPALEASSTWAEGLGPHPLLELTDGKCSGGLVHDGQLDQAEGLRLLARRPGRRRGGTRTG